MNVAKRKIRNWEDLQSVQSEIEELELSVENRQFERTKFEELTRSIELWNNISFISLNLESTNLNVEGALLLKQILDQLSTRKRLNKLSLNLRNNSLQDEGSILISQGLQPFINLKSLNLNLRWNQIKENGAEAIGNSISMLTKLREFTINISQNQFGVSGYTEIMKGISECKELIQLSIEFSGQLINPFKRQMSNNEQLNKFGDFIGGITKLQKLTIILQQLKMDYKEVVNIFQNICKCNDLKRLVIDINVDYSLEIKDISHFGFNNLMKLEFLSLNLETIQMSQKHFEDLGKEIMQCPNLNYFQIKLNSNNGFSENYYSPFLNQIQKCQRLYILRLIFPANKMSYRELAIIKRIIFKCIRLIKLRNIVF